MKFHVLHSFTLFICLGQICFATNDQTDEIRNEVKKDVQDTVIGVGERFVDDLVEMREKFQNDTSITKMFDEIVFDLLSHRGSKKSKIDVQKVKDSYKNNDFQRYVFNTKVFQSILSSKMKPERYNGIVNLIYVIVYPNATTDQIQSALNYLYEGDVEATKTSFIDSYEFPLESADDCPHASQIYPGVFDELNSLVEIRPKVVQDFMAIREKFPCYGRVMKHIVHMIKELHGDKSRINACMIKENPGHWNEFSDPSKETMERMFLTNEVLLSTHLTKDIYEGLNNLAKATIPDTPIDEIEKALEYLYDNVPKTECSESSTLKTD